MSKSSGYVGSVKRTHNGSTHYVEAQSNTGGNMAGSDRPGGMDNIPKTFNVNKKADKGKTDMGKVARIAHVERSDRGVKGLSARDTGGGRKRG